MTARQYRAEFDATVTFTNGGSLRAEAFRVDVPGPDTMPHEVAELFVASLGLLMTDRVDLRGLRVLPEAHKGTRRGPSDTTGPGSDSAHTWADLSHVITPGMTTYPGLPGPEVSAYLSREASRHDYGPCTQLAIDHASMIGNTDAYIDSPFHRFPAGADLAGLPITSLADLPAVVVRTVGATTRAVGVGALAPLDVSGRAVLLHTGGDKHWGTAQYPVDAPYLTERGARWLVDHGALLVGIDAVNIDDIASERRRPAHTVLLAAHIPIVVHLTGLDQLPPVGARFTAAPPRFADCGTFPVRAYAAYH